MCVSCTCHDSPPLEFFSSFPAKARLRKTSGTLLLSYSLEHLVPLDLVRHLGILFMSPLGGKTLAAS